MSAAAARQLISFGPFEFDGAAGLLYRGQREILLPMRVGKVLEILLRRPGEVLSKDELLSEVWKDAFVGEDSLTQAISMLRSALGDDPRDPTYIQTIPKRGYRFIAEVGTEPIAVGAIATEPIEAGPIASDEQPGEPVRAIPTEPAMGVGTSLGHYEIVSELGAGAMGIVYRARDTKLEREVALKVLPEDFISDPDRVARFEREAKLLAAVSHPNIAAIHSLEESGGTKFPVMELVEGETLEERLRSGPMKVDQALEYARQIASALEAAHERGIVHRDLKPANIKLTPAGQVKVLDFGLAKALEVKIFGEGVSESPTQSMTIMGSRRGSIVGTAAYMSPEQARGQEVNKQVDVWAFGCVLYEMLAGRRPFLGDTVSDTIAGVLEREPDWDALPVSTPRAASRLLRRCLTKAPRDRLHDIADARIEVDETQSEAMEGAPVGRGHKGSLPLDLTTQPPRWRRSLPWVVALIAVIALVVTYSIMRGNAPVSTPDHIPVAVPPGLELGGNWINGVAISPDGRRFVFTARRAGESEKRLYVAETQRLAEATEIPGTEETMQPFFSPDGDWLGFFQGEHLKKVRLNGGDPVIICGGIDPTFPTGADWGPDDSILFSPSYASGIWQISADGEELREVTTVNTSGGESEHDWPAFLPGGSEAIFTNRKASMARAEIVRIDLETGNQRVLLTGGYSARYSPTGHVLFGQRNSIFAAPYDLESDDAAGSPAVVIDHVTGSAMEGRRVWALSDTGTLVYVSGGPKPGDNTLVLVDREGNVRSRYEQEPGSLYRFAPDGGSALTFSLADDDDQDIWVLHLARGGSERLTSGPHWDGYPVVSTDGKVAFASEREGTGWDIFMIPIDRSEPARPLVMNDYQSVPGSWSPDGSLLAFYQSHPETGDDIWIYDSDDPASPRQFIASRANETYPMFSPDGRWLAYGTDASGVAEFYVVPYPEGAPAHKISTEGVREQSLRWSPDSKEIFYLLPRPRVELMAESLETEPDMRVGTPRVFFRTGPASPERLRANLYDIHPDGEHFIMTTRKDPEPFRLHVFFNWFEELKRLAPRER